MTATLSLTTSENRWGTQRTWSMHGTTFTVGSHQTALWLWWLYRNGTLIDSSFAGPVFGHVFDIDLDHNVSFRLVYQVIEQDAGSATEGEVTWTHSCTQPTYTKYVDTAGVDNADAGRGDSSGSPYATLGYAMTAIRALMGSGDTGRVLAKAGQTHSVSASLWSSQEIGRICVDRYSTGANPTIDLTADVVLFDGMGQYSSTNNCSVDLRHVIITGGTGYVSEIVDTQCWPGASAPLNQSHVLYDVVASDTGDLVTQGNDGGLSEAEMSAGARDFLAVVDCSLTNAGANRYGIYYGGQFLVFDGIAVTNLDTNRSALRSYNSRFLWGRDFSCNDSGDAFRILSWTLTADLQARWQVFESFAAWNCPYLFHNSDSEGGDTTINKFWDQWFHGCRANVNNGMAWSIGGDRKRIGIRGSWMRNCSVVLERNNADNDEVVDLYIECMTGYASAFGGGDTLFVAATALSAADTVQNWRVRNNFWYAAGGSGTGNLGNFSTASGNIATATIFAAAGDSDYNVWLVPTGSIRWYRGVTGGDTTDLTVWDDTGRDTHSQVLTAGTHGLTALGSANADDYDFNISTSSVARNAGVAVPGGQIDYDGLLRVTTHDAGANDADASVGPTEPSGGSGGGGSLTTVYRADLSMGRMRFKL